MVVVSWELRVDFVIANDYRVLWVVKYVLDRLRLLPSFFIFVQAPSLSLSLSDCILAITSVVAPKMMNVYSRHSYRTWFFICMWVTVCICIYIYNMRERCEMVLCIFFGYYVVRMILWGLKWQSNTIYSVRASDRTQQQYKATAQNTYTPNQFFAVKYNSGHMRFNTKYLKLYCTSVHNYGCSSTGNSSSSSSRIAFVHIIERESIYFLPEYENKNEKSAMQLHRRKRESE